MNILSIIIACLATCAVSITVFLIYIRKRNRKIAKLSEHINLILHGDDSVELSQYHEGELYILASEIGKMTVRLREQATLLKKDKAYLADSLADIAHQLRTPMTSLGMLISFMKSNENFNNEQTREAEELLRRMDWLLTTLLKISKIDAGTAVFKRKSETITDIIGKSAEPFAIQLELRGIELKTNCKGSINCDINWTSEAIGNIIKNCMDYAGCIEIMGSENAIYSEIIVTDNGKGISEEELPHIFERFYQGEKSSNDNYGIGLALCKMILSEQNATVKAENRKDGARFILKFYKS